MRTSGPLLLYYDVQARPNIPNNIIDLWTMHPNTMVHLTQSKTTHHNTYAAQQMMMPAGREHDILYPIGQDRDR